MTLPTDPKERKEFAMFTFLTEYFPDAIEELVRISIAGNRQHNPGEKLHWSRGKSTDQLDTAFRHMWDHKRGTPIDTDGCWHLGKSAWRCLAELQLAMEAARAKPKAAPPIGYASPRCDGKPFITADEAACSCLEQIYWRKEHTSISWRSILCSACGGFRAEAL